MRLGFNYRLSDVAAAIGIGQLERLDEILAAPLAAAKRYNELLRDIDGVELPCADDETTRDRGSSTSSSCRTPRPANG